LFSGLNFTTVYIPLIRFYIKLKKHVLKGSLKHANKDSCPGYTCVERGTVGFKCLPQEQNTMCPARVQTRTARSVVEVTNHEATAPMYSLARSKFKVATFLMNAVNIIPEMFVWAATLHWIKNAVPHIIHEQPLPKQIIWMRLWTWWSIPITVFTISLSYVILLLSTFIWSAYISRIRTAHHEM